MEVRLARIEDAKEILEIYSPYILNTNITFEYEIPSLEEFQQRMHKIMERYPYYVAVEDNKIIGYAYASTYKERKAYDWCCELSIYVNDQLHHRGVGKELYHALLMTLKQMNYQLVYACISYPNDKSVAFHQTFGFKKIAYFEKCGYKFNQWHDMIWMEKRIGDSEKVCPIKTINDIDPIL